MSEATQLSENYFDSKAIEFYFKSEREVVPMRAIKTYERKEVKIHSFLTLLLDRSQWSASWLDRFQPVRTARSTHWSEGWVGTTAGLDTFHNTQTSLNSAGTRTTIRPLFGP